MAADLLAPVTLAGDLVELAPLRTADHDDLVAAASDGRLWELWYTSVPDPAGMAAEIDRRLAEWRRGTMLPFTVRRRDGRPAAGAGTVVGMTTFMDVDPVNRRVEIGSTWTAASAQRTGVNTESKLLLLTHAFDTLDCIAVEFRTHWHNRASRAAIARLGAHQDGVLRSHRVGRAGELRDTVVFSIVAAEWPAVRASLQHRLDRHRAGADGAAGPA